MSIFTIQTETDKSLNCNEVSNDFYQTSTNRRKFQIRKKIIQWVSSHGRMENENDKITGS